MENQKTLFNYRYACTINNKFAKIIAFQFIASTLIMCSNMYQLLLALNEADYGTVIILLVYTVARLMQICLYCWFGNEVKLKVCIISIKLFQY